MAKRTSTGWSHDEWLNASGKVMQQGIFSDAEMRAMGYRPNPPAHERAVAVMYSDAPPLYHLAIGAALDKGQTPDLSFLGQLLEPAGLKADWLTYKLWNLLKQLRDDALLNKSQLDSIIEVEKILVERLKRPRFHSIDIC